MRHRLSGMGEPRTYRCRCWDSGSYTSDVPSQRRCQVRGLPSFGPVEVLTAWHRPHLGIRSERPRMDSADCCPLGNGQRQRGTYPDSGCQPSSITSRTRIRKWSNVEVTEDRSILALNHEGDASYRIASMVRFASPVSR